MQSPTPPTIEQVAADLAAREQKTQVTLRLPERVVSRIRGAAQAQNVSINELCAELICRAVRSRP